MKTATSLKGGISFSRICKPQMISISQSAYEVGLTEEQNKAYFEWELLMLLKFFCIITVVYMSSVCWFCSKH